MADETQNKYETSESSEVEVQDRGVFDFLGKKKEEEKPQPQEEAIVTEFEKVTVSEPEGEKKHSLLEKLHRSDSSSSSSSEEEGEDGEKRKKKKKEKKGLKEKIEEKIGDDHHKEEDTSVPVEKVEVVETAHAHPEEKKGFLDKIKEKLPGHKKTEEATHTPPPPSPPAVASSEYHGEGAHHEGEAKEKKGILEKIKEKLPGYHPKTEEEKEKESGAH